jgi:tetraacyldisaccharide 4'-kinase
LLKVDSQWLVDAWYSSAWWLTLLRPIECIYRTLVVLRRYSYRIGIFSRYRASKPVVVVGNITVGGTGKTPVVIALVEALAEQGIRAGVVSRGYGARDAAFPHELGEQSRVSDCGEEALLIYHRTSCPCVVSPSRTAAVRALQAAHSVDVIISDDGLQHYALERDLEILMYDAQAAFGNGYCLPAGPLREPMSRMHSVDIILARGLDDPVIGMQFQQDALINIVTGESQLLTAGKLAGSVYAVAGLGRPDLFYTGLRELGYSIEERRFDDHHEFRAEDFSQLTDKPIIMTEKDAVKCHGLVGDNAWYLQISAILPDAVIQSVVSLTGR